MIVIGLISGTSHDAIDAAAVDLTAAGDLLRGDILACRSEPLDADLRDLLVASLPPAKTTVEDVCRLDTRFGQAFAAAANATVADLGGRRPDLVCSHGQTVFHGVEAGSSWGTLQLGQPAWIAERTGLPVVSDLRSRDIAAGGQGAPLVALFDQLLLAAEDPRREEPVAALNLGGIANASVFADGRLTASFDIGPANALIDAATAAATDGRERFDRDGRRAARGRVDGALVDRLLEDPFLAAPPPKSTGKERYNAAYLHDRAAGVEGDDLIASVTAHAAGATATALRRQGVGRVLVSGGGARNPTLMGLLRDGLEGVTVETTEALGVPVDAKEAIAFAVLGWLTAHGLPGAVPACTGAVGPRVLGSLTPGVDGLPSPGPAVSPRALRLRDLSGAVAR